MEIRRTHRVVWLWGISFVVVLLSGCTHTYRPPAEPVRGYPQTDKIPLTVELFLPQELHAAKWEKHSMGDTWVIPLGDAFTRNAEVVAQEAFSGVVVTNGAVNPTMSGVDAILTPRMALAEQTQAMWAFGSETLTVKLEWALKDLQGNLIWVDTVTGEGEANAGNIFTDGTNGRERVEEMLKDLFHKSFQTISSSRTIREFAATRVKVAP